MKWKGRKGDGSDGEEVMNVEGENVGVIDVECNLIGGKNDMMMGIKLDI